MCSPCLAFLWDQGSGWGGGTWPRWPLLRRRQCGNASPKGSLWGLGAAACLLPWTWRGGAVLLGWQRLNGGCLSQPKLTHKIATQCVCLCVGGNQPAQGKPRWGSWAPSDA